MEPIAETVICCIILIALFVTLVGMTLYDINRIRLDSSMRNARQFRRRPLVSVCIEEKPSDECIESIWNSDYQRIEVVPNGRRAKGKLILLLQPDTILDKTSISKAVQMLEQNPSLEAVEILPLISTPQTIRQLFRYQRLIATAPFISSRAGLGIILPSPLCPIMMRPQDCKSWRSPAYSSARRVVHIAVFITLLYACDLDLLFNQPILLIACLSAFGLWMFLAISYYPYLSFLQRITYFLLAPVSIFYFMTLSVRAVMQPAYRPLSHYSSLSFWKRSHKRMPVI